MAFARDTPLVVNEHLLAAVLYAALFFETSTDDECSPNLAVKQLEEISYRLGRLSPAEQDEFRRYVYGLAEQGTGRLELRRLVDGLLPPSEAR